MKVESGQVGERIADSKNPPDYCQTRLLRSLTEEQREGGKRVI